MSRQQIIDRMKAIYQLDPCDGSRWTETSDIEEAADIACVRGRAFLNDHVLTWAEGTGYHEEQGR